MRLLLHPTVSAKTAKEHILSLGKYHLYDWNNEVKTRIQNVS